MKDAATIDWLLEPENPAVRHVTMTTLLGRSGRHADVRQAPPSQVCGVRGTDGY